MRRLWLVAAFAATAMVGCAKENPSSTDDANITVTGRVVDAAGHTVQDVIVYIGDAQQNVSGGTFSSTDVVVPYEVVVVRQSARVALFYRGLTRTDPTIQLPQLAQADDRSATVSGTLSGGAGFPPPAGHRTDVVITTPAAGTGGTVTSNGSYSVTRTWQGSGGVTASVHALQWQVNASGLPTAYTGYGSRTGLMLSDGAAVAGQNIMLAPVTSATVTGAVTPPEGFSVSATALYLRPGTGPELFSLARDESGAASFSFLAPTVPGATMTLTATVRMGGGTSCFVARTGLPPTLTGVGLSFLTPPTMVQPGSGAVGITNNTVFRWTQSGRAHVVIFEAPDRPTYVVVTPETSTTIRNLMQLGLPLPAGVEYRWTVYGIQESPDEAAEPGGYAQSFVTFPLADRSSCSVGPRTFRTDAS